MPYHWCPTASGSYSLLLPISLIDCGGGGECLQLLHCWWMLPCYSWDWGLELRSSCVVMCCVLATITWLLLRILLLLFKEISWWKLGKPPELDPFQLHSLTFICILNFSVHTSEQEDVSFLSSQICWANMLCLFLVSGFKEEFLFPLFEDNFLEGWHVVRYLPSVSSVPKYWAFINEISFLVCFLIFVFKTYFYLIW